MPLCGVCLSVTFVDFVEMNNNISLKNFHRRVATPFWFFHTKSHGNIQTGIPLTGASNAGVVGKNRDYRRIPGYRIDDCWGANNNCDDGSCNLPHTPSRISESCLSQPAWTTTTKRREQNLDVNNGKSEAEVTSDRRLRSMYCTIEANCWQRRSIAQPLCDSKAAWRAILI